MEPADKSLCTFGAAHLYGLLYLASPDILADLPDLSHSDLCGLVVHLDRKSNAQDKEYRHE